MIIKVAIDDELVRKAQQLGHHATGREAVAAALREYVQRREQLEILELAGTIDYADDYDYKALRRRR